MEVASRDRQDTLERVAARIRCIGHPTRLRLLRALQDAGEMTVSELQDATGADQATVSRQLAVMRALQVVQARRDGVFVHYRVAEPGVRALLDCIRSLIED